MINCFQPVFAGTLDFIKQLKARKFAEYVTYILIVDVHLHMKCDEK